MRSGFRLFLTAAVLAFAAPAHAACLNPAGNEGVTMYNVTYKTMQFCDGANWIAMGGNGTVIPADTILESMLKAVNVPTDEYCLTYEATVGDFEWQTCGSGGDNLGNHTATTNINLGANYISRAGTAAGLSFDASNNATLSGDLTISGDDLFMATNTAGRVLIADGTNFNPTAVSGDITITGAGVTSIGADKITEAMLKAVNAATDEYCLTYETTTGDFEWQSCGGGGATLNGITAATANQAGINNAGYTIQWNWNSLAGGSALKLASTSTAAASNAQKMLEISLAGANATAGQSTFGIYAANTHTGATSSNYGISGLADGGTFANYGVVGLTPSTVNYSAGVVGRATGTTGLTYGVLGENDSTTDWATGVYGTATGATGATIGVLGETASTTDGAKGVYGLVSGTTGATYGGYFSNASTTAYATAVAGIAAGTSGATLGGYFNNASTTNGATGVKGEAYGTSGATFGVHGTTASTTGWATGVIGTATGASGATFGVYGESGSSTGFGGYFTNSGGGYALATASGNAGIGTTVPQSLLHVANTGYAQFEKTFAGAPTGTDCDAAAELGRVTVDTTNGRWYVCTGTGGWKYTDIGTSGGGGGATVYNAGSSTSINWSNGTTQYTTASCGSFTLSNMSDGGVYTLIVKGATSATCSFTHTGLTFKLPPGHGATSASKHTLYSFVRAGTLVYVSWVKGY